MNAKITITVPVEKLHFKVAEIVEKVASELENTSIDLTGASKQIVNQSDLLKQMEEIDKARKNLALLDANLEDCYSILNGLIKYKTDQTSGQKNVEQSTE
jgi:hypothetical protein